MKIIITFTILLISTISYAGMYSCAVDKSVFMDQDICSSNCDIECSTLNINPDNAGSCDATKYDSFFLYKGNTYAITKDAVKFNSDNNVKILDVKHNDIIKSILQKKGVAHTWLGASDKDMSTQYDRINIDRFTWGDRTKLGYNNFDKSEPDNKFIPESIGISPVYGEHFLVIDDNGLWSDVGYNLDGTEKTMPAIVSFNGVMDCVAGDEIKEESNTSDLLCPDGSDDCMRCVKGYSDSNENLAIGQCSYGNNFTHTSNGIEINVSNKFLCSMDRNECTQKEVGTYYEDVVNDYELLVKHTSHPDHRYSHNDTNGVYVQNTGEGIVTARVTYTEWFFPGGNETQNKYTPNDYAYLVKPKGTIVSDVIYQVVIKHESGEQLFNQGQEYRYHNRYVDHQIPIILRVSYTLKKLDYKYTCSITGQPCIKAEDSKYYCSPYNCYDANDENNIIDNDTDTGLTDPDNNGGYDDNGTCLGVISVFGGTESRCREVALFNTGFAQCCDVLSIEQQREDTVTMKYKMSACTAEEKGLMANRYNDKCVEVGELYCSEYFADACTQEKRTFCCFEDDFQRAFTEAGKELLGRSWGIPEYPDCSGFSVEELQKLGAMGISDHPKMREYAEKFGDDFTDEMMGEFDGTVTDEIPNIEEDLLNKIEGTL